MNFCRGAYIGLNKMARNIPALLTGAILLLAVFPEPAAAKLTSDGVFDGIVGQYAAAARTWETVIMGFAGWLFWTLVTISMTWTFGMMVLRQADLGEYFAELVRFIVFTGFYYWLLVNGPAFAQAIFDTMRQIGAAASGSPAAMNPAGILDLGFLVFGKSLTVSLNPLLNLAGLLFLIITALIAVNMLLLLCTSWILAYAGIFYLGFGGARWTSDMAMNYYRTCLGIGVQLMTMILLVGIGQAYVESMIGRLDGINLFQLSILLVSVIILFVLTNKVPSLLAGIITGSAVGNTGIGNVTAGTMIGGAAGAYAAATGAMSKAGDVLGKTGDVLGGLLDKLKDNSGDSMDDNGPESEDIISGLDFGGYDSASGDGGSADGSGGGGAGGSFDDGQSDGGQSESPYTSSGTGEGSADSGDSDSRQAGQEGKKLGWSSGPDFPRSAGEAGGGFKDAILDRAMEKVRRNPDTNLVAAIRETMKEAVKKN